MKAIDFIKTIFRQFKTGNSVKAEDEDFLVCHDDRCVLIAEDLSEDTRHPAASDKFNRVIADVSKVYPNAVLVGAVAAAKYIRNPFTPRETHDVDVLLDEKDFAEFLIDDIPENTLKNLETYFENSDSNSHSMKHKETGIYIDFLSTESQPIRKKIVKYILQHREKATHILKGQNHYPIDILKPEMLLAMKMVRYCKNPKTERGISDRLDIVKILETLTDRNITVDHDKVREFLNPMEIRRYNSILNEINKQ